MYYYYSYLCITILVIKFTTNPPDPSHLQLQLQPQRQLPALGLLHCAAAGGEGHHRGFLRRNGGGATGDGKAGRLQGKGGSCWLDHGKTLGISENNGEIIGKCRQTC